MAQAAKPTNLLVVSSPNTPELSALEKLPDSVHVVAIGQTLEDLHHLSEQQWNSVEVLLNCGVGKNAGTKAHIQVRDIVSLVG
jgi:hypothetical protein